MGHMGRAGVPEIVAQEVAREAENRWADRAWPGQLPGSRTPQRDVNAPDVLTETKFHTLLAKATGSVSECAICLQHIEIGHKVVRLPCNLQHIFHVTCGRRWLRGRSRACPICRQRVVL